MTNPSILSGSFSDGDYPCVILQMSDQVKFTPSTTSTSGNCVAGTSVTTPVCNSANGQTYQPMLIRADNTVVFGAARVCTAAVGNTGEAVSLFLSTSSTLTGGGPMAPFIQPIASNSSQCPGTVGTGCGIKLTNSFRVSGTSSGTFVVNFNGEVQDQGGTCNLNAPLFSFR